MRYLHYERSMNKRWKQIHFQRTLNMTIKSKFSTTCSDQNIRHQTLPFNVQLLRILQFSKRHGPFRQPNLESNLCKTCISHITRSADISGSLLEGESYFPTLSGIGLHSGPAMQNVWVIRLPETKFASEN